MTSHRTIDLRALGLGASFALALLAGCAGTHGVSESTSDSSANTGGAGPANTGGAAPTSDGGAAPASAHRIEKFTFAAADNDGLTADVAGVIHGRTIALTVPSSTDVTALVPTIDFVGSAIAPASAKATDFSKPVSYVVTAADGSTAASTVKVTVAMAPPPMCVGTAASCSTDVYDRAVAFANANPTRPVSHGTWNQYCAALMYWFGNFSVSASSAAAAYQASTIASLDPTTAPIGAFHYWSLPGSSAGHVGVDLLGEGAVVFMASTHVADHWGTSGYVGVNNVASYNEAAGATYLGWSMDFNGHGQAIAGGGACGAANVPSGCDIPASTTETTGAPDAAFVMRLQVFGQAHGYTGPVDGNSNAATWKAVQSGLAAYGYAGPVNGLPGQNTYKAFQTLAHDHGGYTGPINGLLGPNSYRGFATYLNQSL
jgi:hypothetical protein